MQQIYLLLTVDSVRDNLVGELPDPARGCAREDGAAGHPLPRPHQHLQQRDRHHAQHRGHDGNIIVDAW